MFCLILVDTQITEGPQLGVIGAHLEGEHPQGLYLLLCIFNFLYFALSHNWICRFYHFSVMDIASSLNEFVWELLAEFDYLDLIL